MATPDETNPVQSGEAGGAGKVAVMATPHDAVVGYMTLQFANGGLFDGEPVGSLIHLVRSTRRGTPGPTLCGIDRFAEDGPGWSVGGGITGPTYHFEACPDCLAAMKPLPVGGTFAPLFAAAPGAGVTRRGAGRSDQ